ncbi:MAG: DsbA family protein, partial [Gammaproteobacteria bacterium]|nr:DsbA family protein [Gammaproteobacteria bacterium]
ADGHRPDDPANWELLIKRLDAPDAASRIADPDVKSALRSNTEEAIALGVFGVPTIAVEKELFWGYDMTDMAIAYLKDPTAFEDAEMQRVSDLPIGIERRQ